MIKYREYGFKDKVSIVTGAGTGVGEACAIELAKVAPELLCLDGVRHLSKKLNRNA
jgi:NADP-dependent 3-hydroxy acid dehydrogenase YdfG